MTEQQAPDIGGSVTVHPGVMTPVLVPADDLRPHPDNPRNGDTDAIGTSVDGVGLYRAIVVQRSTGYILAGSHTYMSLVERGATQVPAVLLDVDDATALLVMANDNGTSDKAQNDNGLLLALLDRIQEQDGTAALVYTAADIEYLQMMEDTFASGSASDFLSDLTTDDPDADTEAAGEPTTDDAGVTHFPVTYTFTKEQRDTVRRAVKVARGEASTPDHPANSSDGLAHIAQVFLDAHE